METALINQLTGGEGKTLVFKKWFINLRGAANCTMERRKRKRGAVGDLEMIHMCEVSFWYKLLLSFSQT